MKSTQEITQQVQEMGQWIPPVREQIGRVVIGQKYLVDRLLLGLLANGHILLEGVPGLAKTLTVKTLAACIHRWPGNFAAATICARYLWTACGLQNN